MKLAEVTLDLIGCYIKVDKVSGFICTGIMCHHRTMPMLELSCRTDNGFQSNWIEYRRCEVQK